MRTVLIILFALLSSSCTGNKASEVDQKTFVDNHMESTEAVITGKTECCTGNTTTGVDHQTSVDDHMEITETVRTGKTEYGTSYTVKEYKFTGKIRYLVASCRSDGPCVMEFDGIAVNFGPYINTFLYRSTGGGGVEWIKSVGSDRQKYVGMTAEVSCHITEYIRDGNLRYSRGSGTWKNQNGETVKLRIPRDNPKYYVRFK